MIVIEDSGNQVVVDTDEETTVVISSVGDRGPPGSGGSIVAAHSDLTELLDDDHPQYALADGSRGSFRKSSDPIKPSDLDQNNVPEDRSFLAYSEADQKFSWLSSTYYQPSSLNVTNGTIITGTVASLYTKGDGNTFTLQEVTGVPGFHLTIGFTGVTTFNQLHLYMRYTGGHTCQVQLWNNATTAWQDITSFNNQNGLVDITLNIDDSTNYVNVSEEVTARLYHPSTGVTTHFLYLDYVGLVNAISGGGGVTEHQSLKGRYEAESHPASAIKYTPYSSLLSTDVQAAINELSDAKLNTTAFSGLSKITVGTTAPSNPAIGDLWIDTN